MEKRTERDKKRKDGIDEREEHDFEPVNLIPVSCESVVTHRSSRLTGPK